MGSRAFDWLLVAAWTLGIAWGSLSAAPDVLDVSDTTLHLVAYLGLAWLLRRALGGRGLWWGALVPGALAWLFGFGLEALQALSPHRHFEVRDLIANSIGVALALVLPVRRRAGASAP